MRRLEELIVDLASGIPTDEGGAPAGVRVEVTAVDLTVPIETQLADGGEVRATLPRGRLATGHDPVHGRLAVRLSREGDDE